MARPTSAVTSNLRPLVWTSVPVSGHPEAVSQVCQGLYVGGSVSERAAGF
jgi:hypothetical protein